MVRGETIGRFRQAGDLLAGRYATLRELATAYDTDERYAGWIVRFAFLSPFLTKSIPDGTQPPEITLQRLLKEKNQPME